MFDCFHVTRDRVQAVSNGFQAWSGLKNGVMLTASEEVGFDLLITANQVLATESNSCRMAILVLSTNSWRVIKEQIERISTAIDAAIFGSFVFVETGPGCGP